MHYLRLHKRFTYAESVHKSAHDINLVCMPVDFLPNRLYTLFVCEHFFSTWNFFDRELCAQRS